MREAEYLPQSYWLSQALLVVHAKLDQAEYDEATQSRIPWHPPTKVTELPNNVDEGLYASAQEVFRELAKYSDKCIPMHRSVLGGGIELNQYAYEMLEHQSDWLKEYIIHTSHLAARKRIKQRLIMGLLILGTLFIVLNF